MNQRKQGTTAYPIPFFMVDSADHRTGKTGTTPTVTISKNGAAFGSAAGSVTEIGNGWYVLAGHATDRNTLGDLLIHATAAGADPSDDRYEIVSWDPFAGVTAQQTRDAMKLVPSAGAAAAGSVDDHLDDLAAALAEATTNVAVVSAVDGGTLTVYQAARFSAALTGLAIPADWTAMLWTVKTSTGQADTEAVLQILESNPADEQADGLLYLNGAAGTAADGFLTVNQAAGAVTIWVADSASAEIEMMPGLPWSLKALTDTEGDSRLVAVGTLNIIEQATATVELS